MEGRPPRGTGRRLRRSGGRALKLAGSSPAVTALACSRSLALLLLLLLFVLVRAQSLGGGSGQRRGRCRVATAVPQPTDGAGASCRRSPAADSAVALQGAVWACGRLHCVVNTAEGGFKE